MTTSEELYNLLPPVYRLRDAERGDPLRELLGIIAEQMNLVDEDIARLYDNWFIETADEWVVPYIGDLLGVRGLHHLGISGFTQRARVANTLAYRRRKGTATMLEQLARDTTLWSARVVEFFKLLATTQYYNHIRLDSPVTPDLRQVDRLDLLDTPFDTLTHTADVRRIASQRGRHNIPNIGIFLWRLQNYALQEIDPRPADPANLDGRYFFSSLGNNTALYNQPRSESTIVHLAEEVDVPAPIRPLAFYLDLHTYFESQVQADPGRRPLRSRYVGPGASLDIVVDEQSLSPLQIMCMDLSAWSRPPTRVRGLFSDPLPAALALSALLSATTPAVQVQIGTEGPFEVVLASVPTTPAEAAAALEAAIRAANPESLAFRNARVLLVNDRLLLLPGLPGKQVTFSASAADATTAGELLLLPANTSESEAALSTRLQPFPTLTTRRVNLRIGALGPFLVLMSAPPTSLEDARQKLEDAIHIANASPEFAQAQVLIVDGRLLILPGGAGGALTFSEAPNDPTTVHVLGLSNRVAVDVELGRLAFPLGETPAKVRVRYNYGFSGDIGGGPYDRRRLRQVGDAEQNRYENSVAAYTQFEDRLEVSATSPATTMTAALGTWNNTSRQSVIQIQDSRTYEEDLVITMGSGDLVIQAANRERPTLVGNITVRGNGSGRLGLNGLLIAGSIFIEENESLRQLDLVHCTLVPGIRLTESGEAMQPGTPSLRCNPDNTLLSVNIRDSICGAIQLPADAVGLHAWNSILDSPLREQDARILPALISGSIPSNPGLTGPRPSLQVAIGNEGPVRVRLSSVPTTRADARDALEAALHAAHDSLAFTAARVLLLDSRLVVLPGIPARVQVQVFGTDDTANLLKLTTTSKEVFALVSGPIGTLPPAAAAPELVVRSSNAEHTISLAAPLNTLAQARNSLEDQIRNVDLADPFFADARVLADTTSQRLVVLPGTNDSAMQFAPPAGDPLTVLELGLQADFFAVAGSPLGERPGPPASFEGCTVLGSTHVKELLLASESIFTGAVFADRRQGREQEDCVRFSYVPPESRTPRRYRCQPELAVTTAIKDREESLGRRLSTPERDDLRRRVLERLSPSFTSTQYGSAAYAQLGPVCPTEIRTGAEDGAEMGVFCFLKQPQREGNLRSSLDEYLRVGLEAGIFYVS